MMAPPMPYPQSQQQPQFAEFQTQPPLQPVSLPQAPYPQKPASASSRDITAPEIYIQPSAGSHFAVELPAPPAPLPPRPRQLRTSTSSQQLNEDEKLAQKLQDLEIEEARARSNSDVSHTHSPTSSATSNTPPNAQHLNNVTTSTTRQHSSSLSSRYGQNHFAYASQVQLSPRASREDVAPEVVINRTPPIPVNPDPSPQPLPAILDPSSTSAYLEQHRQVPYPPQWVLPPTTKSLYGSFLHTPKSDWLDMLDSQLWSPARLSSSASHSTPTSHRLSFKAKGGSFRDPRFQWSMTSFSPSGKLQRESHNWNYKLRIDIQTGVRAQEDLISPIGQHILCTYIHAANYDCLRFMGHDGRNYKWVSHAPVSMLNGHRYDSVRHALFVAVHGNQDPLYGQIVADHCFWDGYVDYGEVHSGIPCRGCGTASIQGLRWKCKGCPDHDVCDACRNAGRSVSAGCEFTLVSLPDETLNIRSKTVDVGMVVATLQVLLDWEKVTLREERRKESIAFSAAVERARRGDLGRVRFWRASDWDGTGVGESVHGTLVKAKSVRRARNGANAPVVVGGGTS